MEDIYRYEFTAKEINDLTVGLVTAKVDNESFIKDFSDETDLVETLKADIRRYDALLDKLRRDYK